MSRSPTTIYRTESGPPDREGWWWGAYRAYDATLIEPRRVDGDRRVFSAGNEVEDSLSDFLWFGPVDMVKEG